MIFTLGMCRRKCGCSLLLPDPVFRKHCLNHDTKTGSNAITQLTRTARKTLRVFRARSKIGRRSVEDRSSISLLPFLWELSKSQRAATLTETRLQSYTATGLNRKNRLGKEERSEWRYSTELQTNVLMATKCVATASCNTMLELM